jgi:hypothetical protein
VPNLDEIAGARERQDYQATLDTVTGILGSHNSHVSRLAINIDGFWANFDALSIVLQIYLDDEQRLRGHFGTLTHTPAVAASFLQLVGELYKLPLDPKLREIVILATGSHHKAAYPAHVHVEAAADLSDLEPDLIAQISRGEKPEDLSEAGSAVYDLALALVQGGGPLSDELFERVKEVVGQEQTLSVIHFVGMYSYINVVCNGVGSESGSGS